MDKKVCTSCGAEKPVSEFHRFGKNGERVGKWCEECYRKNKRATARPPRHSVGSGDEVG